MTKINWMHISEEETRRLIRLHVLLSRVNQTIVRSGSREELLPAICRTVVESGKLLEMKTQRWRAKEEALRRSESKYRRVITTANQAEEALRQSERNYREIFNAANDAIFIHDANTGAILDVNDTMLRMYGFSREEALRLTPNDSSMGDSPYSAKEVRQWMDKAVTEGPQMFEWKARKKTGELFWVEVAIKFAEISGQRRMLAMVRDISARKQAEEELRERESVLRTITASARDAIIMIDEQGTTSFWNAAAERIFGWKEAEMKGRDLHSVLAPPAYHEASRQGMGGFFRTGQGDAVGKTLELSARRKDQTEIPVELSLSGVQLCGKWHAVGILRDITERKQAETALRQSEARFRTLVQNSTDVIGTTDQAGTIQYRSPAITRMLGYLPEEMVGMSTFEYFHPDEIVGMREAFETLAKSPGMTHRAEYRIRHKNGSWRHIECIIENRLDDPAVRGVVFNYRDISERKQVEEELRLLSSRLLNLQDAESRRIARELHDSTAQKLAALNIHLSLLKTKLSETHGAGEKILMECVDLAHDCTQEIRTMSYLLHPPLLDELGLVDSIREYADGFAERSAIRVDLELPPEAADLPKEVELALFRILQESLSNVRRHSGSQTASIRLEQNPAQIQLEVTDAGHGMPMVIATANHPPRPERIGVGLASMRERLRHLGGRLEMDSGPGGTRIRAIIPRTRRPLLP